MMAEIKKEQDESLESVKKVVYPFWIIAFVINGLLMSAYYKQDQLIKKNQKKLD